MRELLDVNRRFRVRHGMLVSLQGALGVHGWLGLVYSGEPGGQSAVVRLLRRGCDTEEIADLFQISVHTVNKRVGSAKRAIGARTRAELVATCLQWGLIE